MRREVGTEGRREPVVITRHGIAVAALVRAEDLEALRRLRATGPEGGLASIAGGWDESECRPTQLARTRLRPVAFLFDTDAISELLRPQPNPAYVRWIQTVHREDQFTSAVCVGELFKGAFGSEARDRHVTNIENLVLPAVTVLPYDVAIARVVGQICAHLEANGQVLPDADIQIGATAVYHGLELVTGNLRHFERVPGIRLNRTLVNARQGSP